MSVIAKAKIFPTAKPLPRTQTHQAIRRLANKISRSDAQINQIIATIDPEAAGGFYVAAELFRLLSRSQPLRYPVDFLIVTGRRGQTRTVERVPKLRPDTKRILLVGDASFSGNTREITRSALQERFPDVTILTATITALRGGKKPDFFVHEVDEREVSFPWGLVDSTGECRTLLEYLGLPEAVKFGYRVWGSYEEFALNQPCTARVLAVRPRQRLSLQVHFQRDEFFVVLDRNTCFELGNICSGEHELTLEELKNLVSIAPSGGKELVLDSEFQLRSTSYYPEVGHYILVPRGVLHRLSAPRNTVRVVEISFGFYDQDGDIARLEDDYGRKGLPGRF